MKEVKVRYGDGSFIVEDISTVNQSTRTNNGVTLLSGGSPVCLINESNNGNSIVELEFTNGNKTFVVDGDSTQDWIGIIIIIIGALLLL